MQQQQVPPLQVSCNTVDTFLCRQTQNILKTYVRQSVFQKNLLFNIVVVECPSGYEDLFEGSDNCFKKVTDNKTWDNAKLYCENDNAMLACFGSQEERDFITNACDECWVGYKWETGA